MNRLIKILVFGFFLCTIINKRVLGKTITKIHLLNSSNKQINCYYIDNTVSFGHPINLLNNDSVNIISDTDITLFIADSYQTMYILTPGKSYYFNSDNNRTFLRCKENDKNEEMVFTFFENLIKATGPLRNLSPINFEKNNYDYRQKFIEKSYDDRVRFLNEYLKEDKNSYFKKIAKNIITAYFIKESLNFPKLNTEQDKVFYESYCIKADMFRKVLPLLDSPYYYPLREAAFAYNDFIKRFSDSLKKSYLSLGSVDTIALSFYNAHNIAYKILSAKSAKLLDSLELIISSFSFPYQINTELKERIYYKRSELIQSNVTTDKLLDSDSLVYKLSKVLKSKKTIFFYVDFWASWCEPCRKEFKYYESIKRKLDGYGVEFIFISMDNNYRHWKKAIAEYPSILKKTNSFFLMSNFNSHFATQHHLTSIPRYMIINQAGKIIEDDAPRPSDNSLIPLLQKLLKENTN